MIPTLIVLGLLAVGVAIVAFATRHRGSAPAPLDPETGWNDPITPANAQAGDDPFAHAPSTQTPAVDPVRASEPQA